MNKILLKPIMLFTVVLMWSVALFAGTMNAEFKIEGLISSASPKALKSALEEKLAVKIIGLNLKDTDSGWPVLKVEFDPEVVARDKIEEVINDAKDPAGHHYKVHKGPLLSNAPLTEEENQALAKLGPVSVTIPQLENTMLDSSESAGRGEKLFRKNCTKCHGRSGNGFGPVAHGFTTWPRQLWSWNSTGPETDGYLFWFITNGRSVMPPWGIILSEDERWDLVSYIKTLKSPANQ